MSRYLTACLKTLLILGIFLLVSLPLSSCGGGSSSDGNNDNVQIDNNACDIIPSINSQNGVSTKIFAGTACQPIGSAFVRLIISSGEERNAICSGTLLSSNKLITAAHCVSRVFTNFSVGPNNVLVQGLNLSAEQWSSRASAINIHPIFIEEFPESEPDRVNFSSEVRNDIAIITLATTPSDVVTMPLALSNSVDNGDIISIFGYGTTESGDFGSLRSGEMLISQVRTELIGAEFLSDRGSNTCTGDSGGPAIINTTNGFGLIGATSFGTVQTCEPGDVTFFTNLRSESNLTFIQSIVPEVRAF